MGGLQLMALYWNMETSGKLKPRILRPINPGANPLEVSEAEKQDGPAVPGRLSATLSSLGPSPRAAPKGKGARPPRRRASPAHRLP